MRTLLYTFAILSILAPGSAFAHGSEGMAKPQCHQHKDGTSRHCH